MKPKLLLGLALVLGGGLTSICSSAKGATTLFPITEMERKNGLSFTNSTVASTNLSPFEWWATNFAADQKDFSKEQIDAIWPELWKMGATPVKAPKVDPLTESQVGKEMAGKWNVLCAPKVFYISLETNRQVSVGGIHLGEVLEKRGEWKVVSDKLLLFVPGNSLPDFIFHTQGKTCIYDPNSDTLMSEMRRPDRQAEPETGAQPWQPIRPVAGRISKAQVLDILDSRELLRIPVSRWFSRRIRSNAVARGGFRICQYPGNAVLL